MPLPHVLVFTGFHRSATSAVANYLNNAGLHFGDNLIPPYIANTRGYFEEIDVVKMHENWLNTQGSSWQYHGEISISQQTSYISELHSYIAGRDNRGRPWALKDPRICLFLPSWKDALKDRARFCFIIRSWPNCIESLHNRHSRELSYLTARSSSPQHLVFWQQPELAARMWLHYNEKLLLFVQENRDKCIVATQRAVLGGAPILYCINELGEFHLNLEAEIPFEKRLLSEKASIRILSLISSKLRRQLDCVWEQLLAQCDLKTNNETVKWYFDSNTRLISSMIAKPGMAHELQHADEHKELQRISSLYKKKNGAGERSYYEFYENELRRIPEASLLSKYRCVLGECATIQQRSDLAARIIGHLQRIHIFAVGDGSNFSLCSIPHIEAHQTRLFPKNQGADKYIVNGLAAKCDWVILSDEKAPQSLLIKRDAENTPKTVFLSLRNPFSALNYFYHTVLPLINDPFILISGSEDVTVPQQCDKRWRQFRFEEVKVINNILECDLLIKWVAENLVDNCHPKMSPIPLGLVYSDSQVQPHLPMTSVPSLSPRKLSVLCAHRIREGKQWQVRQRVSELVEKHWFEFSTLLEQEISEHEFFAQCKQHSFVLCVEGGGTDPAPKAWHVLLNGAIPIIHSPSLKQSYQYLPVIFVDDWEPNAVTFEKLMNWKSRLIPWFDDPVYRKKVLKRLGLDFWWEYVIQPVCYSKTIACIEED